MLSRALARHARSTRAMHTVASSSAPGITHLHLAEPPANLFSRPLMVALREHLSALDADPDVRGVVLRSDVRGIFCAGLDITAIHAPPREELEAFWAALQDLWLTLYGMRTPIYAAMTGAAPAAGCLLAICCDERGMVRKGGRIGLNETQLGILPPEIMFARPFEKLVGPRKAERFMQQGLLLTPEEAQAAGLIDDVCDSEEELMTMAEQSLLKYAALPSKAVAETKLLLRGPLLQRLRDERATELKYAVDMMLSDLAQKNVAMYLASLKKKGSSKK
eukprot:NODE_2848_length_1106_cov_44.511826_g2612_i0.p1 GENE.NODE_2848_length_1106_cov_44.511826_g2612_i0~~NODE_2848_length_1106_cov_44.511826_g2612_i0.p1  ORF type:complete len:277 (+),score=58.78 NODE_2848_length_1106_cov_44.511826_g2612_i0:132-962(+)